MTTSQITDFVTAVNNLIPSGNSSYLLVNPSSVTTFNSNYQIADANVPTNTINANKLLNFSITNT